MVELGFSFVQVVPSGLSWVHVVLWGFSGPHRRIEPKADWICIPTRLTTRLIDVAEAVALMRDHAEIVTWKTLPNEIEPELATVRVNARVNPRVTPRAFPTVGLRIFPTAFWRAI